MMFSKQHSFSRSSKASKNCCQYYQAAFTWDAISKDFPSCTELQVSHSSVVLVQCSLVNPSASGRCKNKLVYVILQYE